jgi:ATP-dependent RNA helicase RhlE
MQDNTKNDVSGFSGLGISPSILAALDKLKLTSPTPIQRQAIPVGIAGDDIIGIAQTGTGKTYAFGIPMLQQLAQNKGKGLILLPTRELALQVAENLQTLGRSFGLRAVTLIGGESFVKQLAAIKANPHIIVATPGRLIDHLGRRTVRLDTVKMLVLDEADMMLDMGFMPQVNEILRQVPTDRQTMLFSATMPQAIAELASKYMKLPVNIEVAPAGTTAEKVNQDIIVVSKDGKFAQLEKLLADCSGSVLIFTRTKYGAKSLTSRLRRIKFEAAEIHSNRSLNQRREALDGFKAGKYQALVATDIAARGIDVKGIELVVNFDLPSHADDYVHRIGRTGRAGMAGRAVSLATPDQWKDIRDIEKLIQKEIPRTEVEKLAMPQTTVRNRFQRRGPSEGGVARHRRAGGTSYGRR